MVVMDRRRRRRSRQSSASSSSPSPPPPPLPARAVRQKGSSIFDDQDGAQAALQPAMSQAASHLTSPNTPAAEKAAFLGRREDDSDDAEQQNNENSHRRPSPPRQPRPPSPSPGRRRSKSTGQEALRRISKAFPTHLLTTSFFSGLAGEHRSAQQGEGSDGSKAVKQQQQNQHERTSSAVSARSRPLSVGTAPRSRPPPRPAMLRRVTSEDSVLYHTLSRSSSLGDDERFQDVREMVNIRFMALKDSLPEVPNFKMPSLSKLQVASRMSSISLNGFFSSFSDDSAADADKSRDAAAAAAAPTDNAAAAAAGSETAKANNNHALDHVLDQLTGDIVVLGGYRGSVLRSADPPHHQLWAPVKLGFNMRKANLEVGLDDDDEATMEERIIPSGMLQNVGPVDISRKLFKRLRSCPNAQAGKLRVWDWGYDWRLSPALTSRRLLDFVASLPSNKEEGNKGVFVIAHSLGGLITRHAVNQRPELFAGVLYAGVPQRCINILGPMRNGDAVLFNEKLLTAQVNFSIRTSFALLPDDGFCFVNKETGESYPVDFFDPEEWIRWRLSPCVSPSAVPPPPSSSSSSAVASRARQPSLTSSSPLSSLFPNSRLKASRGAATTTTTTTTSTSPDRRPAREAARDVSPPSPPPPRASSPPDRDRYVAYLGRVLAATRRFRAELAHRPELESDNAYPPHAVLYGKSIPTVYAAQVPSREAICAAEAYDDLQFRPGDGVVLAREAMLPPGYALVRAGRVRTERGHLTMLGDWPAVARALEALVRGRNKGIGLGRCLDTAA
ncbi:hypothetical protein CP532_2055 [Ophiocordyceps camponoti-leonardi (nom. inval.)]|nr:hypothetical protein CP532_2055 [Ophiocordyceps camponoti-leonardi (nom. inval.)]